MKVEFKPLQIGARSEIKCVVTIPHRPGITLNQMLMIPGETTRFFKVISITSEFDTIYEVGTSSRLLLKDMSLENAIEILKGAVLRFMTEDERAKFERTQSLL